MPRPKPSPTRFVLPGNEVPVMVRYVHNCRGYFVCLAGAAALLSTLLAGLSHAQPRADPVQDLKDSLYIHLSSIRDPKALAFRQNDLDRKVDALRTVGELRRALLLTGWKDADFSQFPQLGKIDRASRTRVADRLTAALQKAA